MTVETNRTIITAFLVSASMCNVMKVFLVDRFEKCMKKCRRVYPHHTDMEGIFLAKIKKL